MCTFRFAIAIILALLLTPSGAHAAWFREGRRSEVPSIKRKMGFPYQPGPSSSPPSRDKLPFSTGSIISLESDRLETLCNVDPDTAELRCDEAKSSEVKPSSGFMVLGLDYMTRDIYSGDKIYLKSQEDNKFCSVGPSKDGSYVTCAARHCDKECEFIAEVAGPEGSGLIRLRPADSPHSWCHPEEERARKGLPEVHVVRCGGQVGRSWWYFKAVESGGGYGPPYVQERDSRHHQGVPAALISALGQTWQSIRAFLARFVANGAN